MCTLFYAIVRRFFRLFDASVHTERTRVATITRLKSGSWRAQVRRKEKYVNETFLRRKDAEEWGIDIERRIDRQEPTTMHKSREVQLFGDLITLHRQDLVSAGRVHAIGNDVDTVGLQTFDRFDYFVREIGSLAFRAFGPSGTVVSSIKICCMMRPCWMLTRTFFSRVPMENRGLRRNLGAPALSIAYSAKGD